MAKLKGMDKILNIVNKFTKKFGITAYWNEDFEAVCDHKAIGFTLTVPEDDCKFFMNDARARYPYIDADPFLWMLMHEIGHIMTDEKWTMEELEYFEYQKEQLAYIPDDQDRNDWYHALPDEFMATRWAAMYMADHPKKVAKFWNELQAAIIEFYEINNINEEKEEEDQNLCEDNLIMIDDDGIAWYRVGSK